jgi:surfeit locus 1 family protein
MLLKQLFSKRWIWVTLLAIVAVGVMVRLGIWQLDRLEQRRSFNRQVLSVRDLPPLELARAVPDDLETQLYRQATADGVYDYAHQVLLTNQGYQDQLGVHLLTPMKVTGTEQYILVDRGWVPFSDYQEGKLDQYDQPGPAAADGILANSTSRVGVRSCTSSQPDTSGTGNSLVLFCVDLDAIQKTLPYELAPLYLIQAPSSTDQSPPIGTTVQIEITEGPHLGYAVQWFSFAALLAIGYPFYVYRDGKARSAQAASAAEQSQPVGGTETGEHIAA